MKNKIKNFKELNVWKKGIEIVKDTYGVTNCLPEAERYGLVSQMRRAAVSIPSNIAEGFNRFHNKEYKQFLHIALGSCAELETHVEIALELEFLDKEKRGVLVEKIDHASRMLTSLIKKLV